MIVAMLADQPGEYVESTNNGKPTWFPVARTHRENLLLSAFSHGVERTGPVANLTADKFDELSEDVGVDQLLMIRLAQLLGARRTRFEVKKVHTFPTSAQSPRTRRGIFRRIFADLFAPTPQSSRGMPSSICSKPALRQA